MKIKLKQAIVCEGKYDKIKLNSLFDTLIITTSGFRLYKDKEKIALLRKLASTRGLIVLTDSDNAGAQIRHFIKSSVKGEILFCYPPCVKGKESRKNEASKQGLLGIEGLNDDLIIKTVLDSNATILSDDNIYNIIESKNEISKADLLDFGLIGANSKEKASKIKKHFNIPEYVSSNEFLEILNNLTDKENLIEALEGIDKN